MIWGYNKNHSEEYLGRNGASGRMEKLEKLKYQLGHVEEAMKLFFTLTTLPKGEEDLS